MASESTPLPDGRLPILVVSHERSGTHFTMNALAACFGYVSRPWLDIDQEQFNINYFHAPSVKDLLLKVAALRWANLVKCHHEFEFFQPIAAETGGVFHIVYVYRNPADAMASFWRFLHTWEWAEGPAIDTALDFATAAPMGRLMRYQYRQYPTMLDRWANHVERWIDAAARVDNIHVIRYEDLAAHYSDTMQRLGRRLDMQPSSLSPPARDVNVVQSGTLTWTPAANGDNRDAITELALARYPALLARLGYGPAPVSASAV